MRTQRNDKRCLTGILICLYKPKVWLLHRSYCARLYKNNYKYTFYILQSLNKNRTIQVNFQNNTNSAQLRTWFFISPISSNEDGKTQTRIVPKHHFSTSTAGQWHHCNMVSSINWQNPIHGFYHYFSLKCKQDRIIMLSWIQSTALSPTIENNCVLARIHYIIAP